MALILPYGEATPRFGREVFVAPNATVIGDVEIGDGASIWFGAVLRGDVGKIQIGARTNIQDLACVHVTDGVSWTRVGEDVTVGHGAILHGCIVGDGCLIGMGSILLDNAEIGAGSVVAAGAVVPPRMVVPPRSLVRGNPAKVVGEVRANQADLGRDGAAHYVENARRFREILAAQEAQEAAQASGAQEAQEAAQASGAQEAVQASGAQTPGAQEAREASGHAR
ncbi:gamma carbonic anhydrase family protein [Chondromyces apiculatus]|uniref:Carbonic anhydrase, family 3 n=1 Tax=Chondromyces apiculatus DSM 436 TaxID=1192034 RepID=A0A017TIM0_9BACT|nr:gamma carbonic anhydrase family protein [Chondromyces apiculatus]EYF08466.1 carbonic anhydrase, family 3 [Chondromyces apiculatus DSM 436]